MMGELIEEGYELKDEYSTKDLYIAAFLQVKGLVIERVEKYSNAPNRQNPAYFIFKNRDKCEKLQDAFWRGTGEVVMGNLKTYFSAIRDLRSRAITVSRSVSDIENRY